jgi:hypothetical protein
MLNCRISDMTVDHIRNSDAARFSDFCCIIEASNEKSLKHRMIKINTACFSKFAEDFNWTEVRLMHVDDFNSRRASFFERPMSLGRFTLGLQKLGHGTLSITVTFLNDAMGEETEVIAI